MLHTTHLQLFCITDGGTAVLPVARECCTFSCSSSIRLSQRWSKRTAHHIDAKTSMTSPSVTIALERSQKRQSKSGVVERVCIRSYFRDSGRNLSLRPAPGFPEKGWSWCFSLELSVWGWTGRMPIGCYMEWIHGSVFNMVFKSPSPLLILPFGTLRWYACSVLLLLPVASLSCAVCCPPDPQTLAAEIVWAFNLGVSETL